MQFRQEEQAEAKSVLQIIIATLIGSALGSGFNAALGALSGCLGGVIVTALDVKDHNIKESIDMTALGGAVTGTAIGLGSGLLYSFGFFKKQNLQRITFSGAEAVLLFYILQMVINGLLGDTILRNDSTKNTDGVAAMDAAFGAFVLALPLGILLACCQAYCGLGKVIAQTFGDENPERARLRDDFPAAPIAP